MRVTDIEVGTVLVSGAASGLGAAVARAVVEAGGTSLGLDRVAPDVEIDHEVVDLVDGWAAEAAVARLLDRHPDLTGVVTAAGTDACGRLEDVAVEDWERVLKVNLLGTAAVVRAALPALVANGGRVTVASTLGLRALSDATAYCASKFGVFDSREDKYKPPPDAKLNRPADVAAAVVSALRQPPGCEVRELLVAPSLEGSWP